MTEARRDPAARPRILLVDDDDEVRTVLGLELDEAGYEAVPVGDAGEAMRCLREGPFEVVLSDVRMPGMDGIELIRWVKEEGIETEVVLMTGYGSLETAVEALRLGACDYLMKPFREEAAVLWAMDRAIERRLVAVATHRAHEALRRRVRELERALGQMELGYQELAAMHAELTNSAGTSALRDVAEGLGGQFGQAVRLIKGVAEKLRREAAERLREHAADLAVMIDEAERLGRLVDNLRWFALQATLSPGTIDPRDPVQDALEDLARELHQDEITVDGPPGGRLPAIRGDRERLRRAYRNLLTNAREALARRPRGHPRRISISMGVEEGGRFVACRVEDSGPGVSAGDLDRIFTPFYTTKPEGKGVGLGLTVAAGIVGEHDGTLQCLSEGAEGAVFVVRLPIAAGEGGGAA